MKKLVFVFVTMSVLMLSAQLFAQDFTPADGWSISTRISGSNISSLSESVLGAPQFSVGRRSGKFSFGLGLGYTQFLASDTRNRNIWDNDTGDIIGTYEHTEEITGSVFRIGPDALMRFWKSETGQTEGNLSLGVTYGKLTYTEKDVYTENPNDDDRETKHTATLIGYRIGTGADHFFDEHFAIGLEVGIQGTLEADADEEDRSVDYHNDYKGAVAGGYGALRLTVIF